MRLVGPLSGPGEGCLLVVGGTGLSESDSLLDGVVVDSLAVDGSKGAAGDIGVGGGALDEIAARGDGIAGVSLGEGVVLPVVVADHLLHGGNVVDVVVVATEDLGTGAERVGEPVAVRLVLEARSVVNVGEVGDVVAGPVSIGKGRGDVSSLEQARDLLADPEGAGLEVLLGGELVVVHADPLVVVGTGVVSSEGLHPSLAGLRASVGSHGAVPGEKRLRNNLVEQGLRVDTVGRLGDSKLVGRDVEVIDGGDDGRVGREGDTSAQKVEIVNLVDAQHLDEILPSGVGHDDVAEIVRNLDQDGAVSAGGLDSDGQTLLDSSGLNLVGDGHNLLQISIRVQGPDVSDGERGVLGGRIGRVTSEESLEHGNLKANVHPHGIIGVSGDLAADPGNVVVQELGSGVRNRGNSIAKRGHHGRNVARLDESGREGSCCERQRKRDFIVQPNSNRSSRRPKEAFSVDVS